MTSNVYTKNEILQNLASKGFFIDVFTLDTFLDKWKVEAIFEDEQGCEFFDVSVVDMVLNSLFNSSGQKQDTSDYEEEPRILSDPIFSPNEAQNYQPQMQQPQTQQPQMPYPQQNMQMQQFQGMPAQQGQNPYAQPQMMQQNMMQQGWQNNMPYPQNPYAQPQMMQQNMQFAQQNMQMQQAQMPYLQQNMQMQAANNFGINDSETASILQNVSLSDGTPLLKGIEQSSSGREFNVEMPAQIEAPKINSPLSENNENKPKRMGILEGAMENVGQTFLKDEPIVAQMKDDTLKQLEEMGLITMEDYDKLKLENIKSDNQKTEEEPKNDTEELQLEEVEAIKIDEISPIAIDEDVPEKNEKSVASEMQTQPQEQNITPQVQENPGFQQIPSIQPQFQPSQTNIQEQPEDQNLVQQPQEIIPPNDESVEFDDMSLLSESYEAQEKFREYIVSELSKKNVDLTPKSNEFKLDISERTLSMIARSMAKKIAKHVNNICTQGTTNQAQIAEIEEKNKKLEEKARELEEQNKKLRILLAETNKNLNSYKPSIFGLYKKVTPKKKK